MIMTRCLECDGPVMPGVEYCRDCEDDPRHLIVIHDSWNEQDVWSFHSEQERNDRYQAIVNDPRPRAVTVSKATITETWKREGANDDT